MNRAAQAASVISALKKLLVEYPDHSINELRIIVALERVVARLDRHPPLSPHLVFKGGFVLLKTINTSRFTRDIDALALDVSRERIVDLVQQALVVDLHDGFWFGDLQIEDLKSQGPYGGYRFNCAYQIGDPPQEESKIKKLSRLHLDVGFGDALEEQPPKRTMTSLLEANPPVSWSVYPLEYIFAEKLEALFSRGSGSSRAKDIYDMPLIFPKCDPVTLLGAIESTFRIRKTPLPISFQKSAKAMNTDYLETAWRAVDLPDTSPPFGDSWDELTECLGVLDQALSGSGPKR